MPCFDIQSLDVRSIKYANLEVRIQKIRKVVGSFKLPLFANANTRLDAVFKNHLKPLSYTSRRLYVVSLLWESRVLLSVIRGDSLSISMNN